MARDRGPDLLPCRYRVRIKRVRRFCKREVVNTVQLHLGERKRGRIADQAAVTVALNNCSAAEWVLFQANHTKGFGKFNSISRNFFKGRDLENSGLFRMSRRRNGRNRKIPADISSTVNIPY